LLDVVESGEGRMKEGDRERNGLIWKIKMRRKCEK